MDYTLTNSLKLKYVLFCVDLVILGFNSQTCENVSLCGNGSMRENAAICGKGLTEFRDY